MWSVSFVGCFKNRLNFFVCVGPGCFAEEFLPSGRLCSHIRLGA